MTIDDDSSIYVGGIPYDCTDEVLRHTFEIYGSVVDIKIINDHEIGGKCYGFVTFRNPRSAINAINEMNGRSLGGRVIRVNEVKTRGGRRQFSRENFRRNPGRENSWGRDRERDHSHDKDRYWDHNIDVSQDHDDEREEEYEQREYDRIRDRSLDRDRIHRDFDNMHWDHEEAKQSRDRDRSRDSDKDRRSMRHRGGSKFSDHPSREKSPNCSEELEDEILVELQKQLKKRDEFQKENDQLQEKLNDKEMHALELLKKSQKLEEALVIAKKISSRQKIQSLKLHKSFKQIQECTERLKSSELELQAMVDGMKFGLDHDVDGVCL
ncbi:hypothetical protein ZOSMA_9G00960 [Zostera marina]|uniref:RRM domain-containing protein n=1 Tax=Zostera marina TaxID=29655 RepID=A0A0K9NGU1_ZOSMR|nr:hypothetical protein ZOSMA_9G00960 [Zostera marina]